MQNGCTHRSYLGVVTTWGLCAVLRFVVREEFSDIPLFGISIFGIACGIFVGLITVLIAANAPAKHAAKVSPITAVSGNTDHGKQCVIPSIQDSERLKPFSVSAMRSPGRKFIPDDRFFCT